MQKRKLNQRKQFKSNHCKRARRKDAEPIIPRMNEISWIIGLFYLKAKKWRITRPPLP